MALFDEIQKRLRKGAAVPSASAAVGEQAETQRVLASKGGKAQTGDAPRASAVAAQAAAGQGRAAADQQQGAGNLAATQLDEAASAQQSSAALASERLAAAGRMATDELSTRGAVAAGNRQTTSDLAASQRSAREEETRNSLKFAADETLKRLAADRKVSERDIFKSFKQGKAELAMSKDAAELEQLLFVRALQDKEYMREIQTTGALNRLQDDGAFKAEAMRLALGNQTTDLLTQLGWQEAFNADQREWEDAMSKLDVDAALAIASAKASSDAQTNYVQAGVKGADTFGKYYTSSPSQAPAAQGPTNPGAMAGGAESSTNTGAMSG
jgi:hypothetical protein